MKYIGSKLLCHTVIAKKRTGMDADRNPTYEEIEVSGVRVVPVRGMSEGSAGMTPNDSMELISDLHTTIPVNFIPELGMQIVFDNRSYTVQSVKPCFADGLEIHHFESVLK